MLTQRPVSLEILSETVSSLGFSWNIEKDTKLTTADNKQMPRVQASIGGFSTTLDSCPLIWGCIEISGTTRYSIRLDYRGIMLYATS
ncbi:34652_t:CDS:2, partial [Racocetra persica]